MAFARVIFQATKIMSSSYTLIATGIATYILIDNFVEYQRQKRAERKAQEAKQNESEAPFRDGRRRS